MTWRFAFFFLLIAFIVTNCSKTQQMATDRSRMMQPSKISSFHPEIKLAIGWMPYQDQKLVQTGRNEWRIVQHQDDDRAGAIPVLMVTYPESGDSILLDMNMENELLGKLIKHSAMTQMPIRRPFSTFFEEAQCQNCHPGDVKVDFDK
jgi:hypothetical protein